MAKTRTDDLLSKLRSLRPGHKVSSQEADTHQDNDDAYPNEN